MNKGTLIRNINLNKYKMGKSAVKPTIGRVVIFVPKEGESHNGAVLLPATIVRTWENTSYENDEVNLKIHTDGPTDEWKTSVPYSETKEPDTWHWPIRE